MNYAVLTFGCRVNQADSLVIEDGLRSRGGVASTPEHADLVIVNTCSVTASADQAARQVVRRIARVNPGVEVVVTGCYATRQPGDLAALPNVVRVVSNREKDDLVAALFGDGDGPCGHSLSPGVAGRTALTLRVQTGCNESCSYCIIPRTRGTGRSRPLPSVIQDIRRAVAAGYKEIAITGVHLGSYGRDLNDGSSLSTLCRTLAEWDEDVLFRISSLEPMDCTTDIIHAVAKSPRIARHFHLPLQHGADEILRAMRRPYTSAYYRGLVDRIRTALPDAAIGSDIIVGFPGENDSHFEATRTLLESLPLTHLHVFPYSDRPGTDASRLSAKVDGCVVRERGRILREIGEGLSRRFKASQAGRRLRALTVDDGQSAVTGNYLKLRLNVRHPRNEWIDVRVENEGHATLSS
jgi:threonylcarbamoyladenosine tRNA methylthiotransferase MtaB